MRDVSNHNMGKSAVNSRENVTEFYSTWRVANWLITFRVRRSRGEMYIGHARLSLSLSLSLSLCVCLSVCLGDRDRLNL